MNIIHATWQDGVLRPDESLGLLEGTRVELQFAIDTPIAEVHCNSDPLPRPDPPFESEAEPAPFDLPMPPGGTIVTALVGHQLPAPDSEF